MAGYGPEVVCKHQAIVDRVKAEGVHVFGVRGEHRVPLRAVREVSDLSGPQDVIFLATKANDCMEAAGALRPLLGRGGRLVSLQNGICEESLAGLLGRERVVGCVTGWGATLHGIGEIEITSPGEFVLGTLDGAPDGPLPFIQSMLQTTAPTRLSTNILGELYSKLIINACINSLGVIAGVNLGTLLADRKARRIFLCIMREAMAVADALGVRVEPAGGGKMDYYRFLANPGPFARLKQHLMIRAIGFKYRRIRSSSLQSLERGQRTEIDHLNGYIVDRAKDHDVPTPINGAVVQMVREIEEGRRAIKPANLHDPAFAHC
jgi:2-dehydropantoate 2-reductase